MNYPAITIIPESIERAGSIPEEEFVKKKSIYEQRLPDKKSRAAYKTHLRQFFEFTRFKHPLEVEAADVEKWLRHLEEKLLKPSTINVKLSVVRKFFAFLTAENMIARNPASTLLVLPPKQDKEMKGRALEKNEVRYLLNQPRLDSIAGARDYALILLMLRCFFRVSEAIKLDEGCFTYERGIWYASVKIKFGETHKVPIPDDVKRAINRYIELDRYHRGMIRDGLSQINERRRPPMFVFYAVGGRKLQFNSSEGISRRQVNRIIAKHAKCAGIGKVTPHDLRRTAITTALDQGESYRRVMNAARLKNLETVQKYDHHRKKLTENSIFTLDYGIVKTD